ncbi:MAG: CoA transferase [Microbacterium sp.]
MTGFSPLAGVRLIEISQRRSGSMLGLIAAGLGADVVAHRPALQDPAVEAVESAVFDRGKRLVESAELAASLVPASDVLVTDLPVGRMRELALPMTQLEAESQRPGLVHVAITSFGLTGPHADWASDDITDWAAGGLGIMTRSLHRDGDASPAVVLPPGRQSEILGGLAGAIGLFAALREVRSTGRAVIADVARVEVQASMSHHLFPAWLWSGIRFGPDGSPLAEIGYYVDAADRPVYVRPVEERHWLALATLLGIPDEVASERVDGMLLHHRDAAAVRSLISPAIAHWQADELVMRGQAAGIPIADPATLSQVLGSPQLAERGAWRDVAVGGREARVPALPLLEPGSRPPGIPTTASAVREGWR